MDRKNIHEFFKCVLIAAIFAFVVTLIRAALFEDGDFYRMFFAGRNQEAVNNTIQNNNNNNNNNQNYTGRRETPNVETPSRNRRLENSTASN